MADTKRWAGQVEEAFRSVVIDSGDDATRLRALKMSVLELMSAAYQEGLGEEDRLKEKRQIVGMRLASGRVDMNAHMGRVIDVVDYIFATVK